jgi:hypothetical protein
MGWLLSIYLLDTISFISILKYLKLGIIHDLKHNFFGIFIGIYKIKFSFGIMSMEDVQFDKRQKGYA